LINVRLQRVYTRKIWQGCQQRRPNICDCILNIRSCHHLTFHFNDISVSTITFASLTIQRVFKRVQPGFHATVTGAQNWHTCKIREFSYKKNLWFIVHARWVLPCYHSMARPRAIGWRDGLRLWRAAENTLNKQPQTNDKGWSSSFGGWAWANNSSSLKISMLCTCHMSLKLGKILPVVLHGHETWSLTLRGEHRLRMFGNRVLSRPWGSKRDEVMVGWREVHNKELRDKYN
jgi:hypothetical protein